MEDKAKPHCVVCLARNENSLWRSIEVLKIWGKEGCSMRSMIHAGMTQIEKRVRKYTRFHLSQSVQILGTHKGENFL